MNLEPGLAGPSRGVYRMRKGLPKTAVVTGAASGIGRAVSVALATEGWKVGIADIDMPEAENTLEKVVRAGGTGEVFECNVRSLDRVQAMADHFFETWGSVGLLMNNAGVGAGGEVGVIPIEDWRTAIETDLWGAVYGCHCFLPRMKEQGTGHIVNTASFSGISTLAEMAPYNMAKAAVIALSQTLKIELAPHNIGVTVLCPLFVATNVVETTLKLCNVESYADEFGTEFLRSGMRNSGLTPEILAQKVLGAVDKNRLYLLPTLNSKLFWLSLRVAPSAYFSFWAALNERGSVQTRSEAVGGLGHHVSRPGDISA